MHNSFPSFSIIVPTYNRRNTLHECLVALSQIDYPRNRFETIVVNDGSHISLDPVITPFRGKQNVKLIKQPNSGPAAARNWGAENACGNFLAFTDDDCMPAPSWLKKLAARFAEKPINLIGGYTINALPHNIYSTASQELINYLYTYYIEGQPNGSPLFTSNNIAMPADKFFEIGGFDTTFHHAAGEDREFCDRWLHHGYQMTYAPEATVYHAHFMTLKSFCHQHFNYGRGAFHYHKIRASRNWESIMVEPASFYLNLLCYPFHKTKSWGALPIAMLLAVSQVANAAGFLWEKTILFQKVLMSNFLYFK